MKKVIFISFLILCFFKYSLVTAQQATYAAKELDKIWSPLNGDIPFYLKIKIIYSSDQSSTEIDSNLIKIWGLKDRMYYTMDNDIEMAVGSGVTVEVDKITKNIYITNDTFKRPNISQFGVFKLMEKDSLKYKCRVIDQPGNQRKIIYELTGSANPYTAIYYNSATHKPDSTEMKIITEFDPNDNRIIHQANVKIIYCDFTLLNSSNNIDFGPERIVNWAKDKNKWVPTNNYAGYCISYNPIINIETISKNKK